MSMLSGQSLGPSKNGGARSGWATVLLVILMMAVLFGAGFGISWLLRGGTNNSAAPTVSGSPGASPCTTVTVVPAATLPKPGKVTANVYNGTDRSGLARRTATELTARGFIVAKVANDPPGSAIDSGSGSRRPARCTPRSSRSEGDQCRRRRGVGPPSSRSSSPCPLGRRWSGGACSRGRRRTG